MPSRVSRAGLVALAVMALIAVALAPASGQPEQDVPVVERLAGDGRVETAVAISADSFESSAAVVIARADDYADALAGAPLAGALDAPILLSDRDAVPQVVLDEIQRLGATEARLLGGTAALSDAVEAQLVAAGLTVSRDGGSNRYETALLIAQGFLGDDPAETINTVYFVEGENADPLLGWPDAVSVSWLAAGQSQVAIVPVLGTAVPAAVLEAWQSGFLRNAAGVIVGGTAAVSEDVEATLVAALPPDAEEGDERDVTRLSGDSRFATAGAIYDVAVASGGRDPAQRYLATGGSFADALAAGPAVAHVNGTLLLVDGQNLDNSPAAGERLLAAQEHTERIVLLGGPDAISPQVEAQVTVVASTLAVEDTVPAPFCLTVLHNNDGESQLLSAPGQPLFGGLARFSTLVGQEKQMLAPEGCGAAGTITVTSGDNFLAGPEFNASLALPEDQPIYDAVGLDHIGYDALDLGNHDFDFGPDVTARFISSFASGAPFLSANLDFSAEPVLQELVDADRIAPSTTVDAGGVQVGIIGLTTPILESISSPRNVVVNPDVVGAVQEQVEALEGAGVEHIVLISHLQGLSADLELVPQLRGVDAVVAGGGDEVLGRPGELFSPGDEALVFDNYPLLLTDAESDTVPVVTTSGNYKYVGRLVLRFGPDGELLSDAPVHTTRSRMVRVADETLPGGVDDDPFIVTNVIEPVTAYVEGLAQTVIGQTEVALDGTRATVRSTESNVGNLLTDSYISAVQTLGPDFGIDPDAEPIIGLTNGGGIRNDAVIPTGPLTELDTFDIAPFGNFVAAMPGVTAEHLEVLLEHGFAVIGGGQFPQLGGLTVVVDPDGTAQALDDDGNVVTPGTRVVSVTLDDGTEVIADGEPVDGAPSMTLGSIDFTLRDGDAYPFSALGLTEFTPLGISYQQSLSDFIQGPLAGVVAAADYPLGGEGRIVFVE